MNKNLPKEIERKYLIKRPTSQVLDSLPDVNRTEIEQIYLNRPNPSITRRIRKRGTKENGFKYYYTEKIPVSFGEKIEIEKEIVSDEYLDLKKDIDKKTSPIYKERYCFNYKNQFFELDVYDFSDELATLEIELDNINTPVELPDFIELISDVTGDKRYSNAALSYTHTLKIFE